MKILLLGSGGREHCLAWKMSQSDLCEELFIAPGNGGTESFGHNVSLNLSDFDQITEFILDKKIDMLVVGPEDPLVKGITNHLRAQPHLDKLLIVGPDKKGAMLEGSKAFAKHFMVHYRIPTAGYGEYATNEREQALKYLNSCDLPIVIKADGLAAGKGVVICHSIDEAKKEVNTMLDGKFGDASAKIVIEDFLAGREFSVFVLTDGQHYKILPIAKDYKKIGEGDEGPNTGGMGSVSPVSFVTDRLMEKVEERIIKPTVQGIKDSGHYYRGIIFFGLIEVDGEPFVIEYNCRFGDPETQVVLPRLNSDLVKLFELACNQKIGEASIDLNPKSASTVIMVSGGYPGSYEKGKEIKGADGISESIVFHAGTKREDGKLQTNGGRVLAVTSMADTMQEALSKSYSSIEKISFDKQYFRRDIGFDV